MSYGATPVRWTDVPDSYPECHLIGYGAVDAAVRGAAHTLFTTP